MLTPRHAGPWIHRIPASVAVLDREGTIVDVNAAWKALAERNGAGIARHGVGLNYVSVCTASGEHETARALREVLGSTRKTLTTDYPCHSPLARRWYRMEAVASEPDGALLFHWEITPQFDFEARMNELAKLDIVARIASTAAHDFGNLLTAIIGHASALQRDPRAASRDDIGSIMQLAEHASVLTRRLLTLSRQKPAEPQLLDVGLFLQSVLPILSRVVGTHGRVELAPIERAYLVHVDPMQLEQVILNLVINARDAMEEGGRVRIQVEPEGNALSRGSVAIHVEDTGTGIAPENLLRIFEPFFTTKAEGQGTGLGLSSVRDILSSLGGSISAQSQEGNGSKFSVRLPLARSSMLPAP